MNFGGRSPLNRPTTYLRTGANARTAYPLLSTSSIFASCGTASASSGFIGRPVFGSTSDSSNPAYCPLASSILPRSGRAARTAAQTPAGVAGAGTVTVACVASLGNLTCTVVIPDAMKP